ncbi:hypothetical protein BJ875DRAFT_513365 [Amylocarpus encephaloides]|uniref:Uncharacterized protein n=1 Tax=Amylocarpus encephaloides TaxID=45428 RepID=A0A9P7YQS5_9HELO|nr:hypothetical protein BJ875DRAFT_513365 [Amylocarpus encephaloides]
MLKHLTILPLLTTLIASSPTIKQVDDRGLLTNPLDGAPISVGPITVDLSIATALEAALAGVTTSVIDHSIRLALAIWLNGPGSGYCHDRYICDILQQWCTGPPKYYLPQQTRSALEALLNLDVVVSGAGGCIPFFNGWIKRNHTVVHGCGNNGSGCSCSCLPPTSRDLLSGFVELNLDLEINILAALRLCAAGGIAELLTLQARAQLLAWLALDSCPLDIQLILLVRSWLKIGTGVTAPGSAGSGLQLSAFTGAILNLPVLNLIGTPGCNTCLTPLAQGNITQFCRGSSYRNSTMATYLTRCTTNSSSSSLSLGVILELLAFLTPSSCPLDPGLIAALLVWLSLGSANEPAVTLSAVILNQIRVLLGVNVNLSPVLGGALRVVGGGLPGVLGVDARAELVTALLGIGADVNLGLDSGAVGGILGWLLGVVV